MTILNVEPQVFLLAHTQSNHSGITKWLDHLGTHWRPPADASPGEIITTIAAKRCYLSYHPKLNPNVSRVRTDIVAFIDNILTSKHGSTLEHVAYTFGLEGVSRIFTAELNRHRAGMAVSEQSGRYCRYGEFVPYWIPSSLQAQSWLSQTSYLSLATEWLDKWGGATDTGLAKVSELEFLPIFQFDRFLTKELDIIKDPFVADKMVNVRNDFHEWLDKEMKKHKSRAVFRRSFIQAQENYRELENIWGIELISQFSIKKQLTSLFRRIIPLGVATGGVWTGNLRALRHIFTMRCNDAAEEEAIYVASMMLELMMKAEPTIFRDFEKVEGFWQPRHEKV